jgi:hypothetical protein
MGAAWSDHLEDAAFVLVVASVLSCIAAHRQRKQASARMFDGAIAPEWRRPRSQPPPSSRVSGSQNLWPLLQRTFRR